VCDCDGNWVSGKRDEMSLKMGPIIRNCDLPAGAIDGVYYFVLSRRARTVKGKAADSRLQSKKERLGRLMTGKRKRAGRPRQQAAHRPQTSLEEDGGWEG
jgi:hypothetical protein